MTGIFIGDLFEPITRLILIMNITVNQVRTRKLILLVEVCLFCASFLNFVMRNKPLQIDLFYIYI